MTHTRNYYTALRRSYRVAKRRLLSDDNAIAICVQLTSEARNLCGKWEVGFCEPPSFFSFYTVRNKRRVLFTSNALSGFLAK